MAEILKSNHTIWWNTIKAFRNQSTRLDKLIADARHLVNDLSDPDSDVTLKDVRKLVDPIG